MPRFCANLNFLFTEVPLLDRFEAAAKAGFKAVEIGNPYEASAGEIAAKLKSNGLALALINTSPGDAAKGERGRSALAGREKDFDADLEAALAYCAATGCKLIHVMAGVVHQGARRETFVANLRKAARKGLPIHCAFLITFGKAVKTRSATPASTLLARPATEFCSCSTSGLPSSTLIMPPGKVM